MAVYSPLGYVTDGHTISHTQSIVGAHARVFQREDVDHDGLGNQLTLFSETERWHDGVLIFYSGSTKGYGYEPGVGRLKQFASDTIYHDGAGNELFRTSRPAASSPKPLRDVASFYSADGKLTATDARSLASDDPMVAAFFTRVFEEYRYDALGRRILVRSRRSCDTDPGDWEAECRQSKIRRIVWDGDEELYEIQMPGSDSSTYLENDTTQVVLAPDDANGQGNAIDPNPYYGRVAYANALGIDQPISITRMGYGDRFNQDNQDVGHRTLPPFLISPLWNERGQAYLGTIDDGGVWKCTTSGVSDTLGVSIGWAEQWFAYMRPDFRPTFWHGGAIQDKAEHSGLLYRRNRYYDSEKGRFTQEDPIGLAGGVNLYGFADGDPVNFSDPFGLCPFPPWSCAVVAGAAAGKAIITIVRSEAGQRVIAEGSKRSAHAASQLAQVGRQMNNILRELGRHDHLAKARLERTGRLQSGANHAKELSDFPNGLRNSVVRLKSMVNDRELSPAIRQEAQRLLTRTSRILDDIKSALR